MQEALQTQKQHFVPKPPNRPDDRAFYRWATLISAAIIGIALAVFWDYRVVDPVAMAVQRGLVGTTTPAEFVTAMTLAFVTGASMIVTA